MTPDAISRAFSLLTLMLGLAACTPSYGGPTVYKETGSLEWGNVFGYSDKKIGEDEYSVVATGNPETDRQRVLDIALLRAAHITQEQHRTYFVILNQTAEDLPEYELVSAPLGGLLVWFPVGETPTKEPRAILLIRLLPPDAAPTEKALKAADVIAEIGKRVPETAAAPAKTPQPFGTK